MTKETDMIVPQDEFFHERTDNVHWNESGWFGFNVPERGMSGAVYTHHRPNLGFVWSGVILWDSTAGEVHDCLWHDFTARPLPTQQQEPMEAKVFGYSTEAGLRMNNVEPLKRYEFSYKQYGCELELAFTASQAPHDSGLVEGWSEWGKMHYEQPGRMTGYVSVDGDRYDVDCLALRDRSWGPHFLTDIARGDFPWGFVSEDHGFLVQCVTQHAPERDPIFGTTELVQAGWYRRDGVTSELVSGERKAERDAMGRPVAVTVDAVDALGRKLHASGQIVNNLNFPMFGSRIFWHWCLTKWTIDGQTGWGEVQDFFNGEQHRRFAKAIKTGATP
jgi:hypothetical protein